ncbi:hypothetical protein Lfu02_60310 [Longispora fulva]|uniref:DUF4436 domain-containing protein n=1 Tax=Longispora fulva TaxID=619741 RepID=A0A8J7GID8_9ACTN|nr:DUF4436 family protein [Longispora fulva]MBG6136988.1 hypothetical protein [Longispora fulva]GIG61659.1 hypothetical protein Lfu02_60310 [Longispora fulva]
MKPWVRWGVVLLVAGIAGTAGTWLYAHERAARDRTYTIGSSTAPDRLRIVASVQRIDASAHDLVLRVLVVPLGRYAEADSPLTPTRDLLIETTALRPGSLAIPAGERSSSTDLTVGLDGDAITAYPFDKYQVTIGFYAEVAGEPVPVSVEIFSNDPLFRSRLAQHVDDSTVEISFSRTSGSLIMGWFMIGGMWALALAVLAGAWVIVRQRRGLVWPALGWMAATFFALAAFRNTAPGLPPIGSVLDYAAFLWAEAVIAISLAVTAAAGLRVERAPATGPATPAAGS